MGKLFPAFLSKKRDGFCPAEAGFGFAELRFAPVRRKAPQLLLLNPRQIRKCVIMI